MIFEALQFEIFIFIFISWVQNPLNLQFNLFMFLLLCCIFWLPIWLLDKRCLRIKVEVYLKIVRSILDIKSSKSSSWRFITFGLEASLHSCFRCSKSRAFIMMWYSYESFHKFHSIFTISYISLKVEQYAFKNRFFQTFFLHVFLRRKYCILNQSDKIHR